jgi:putative serine/threonine protein kinase
MEFNPSLSPEVKQWLSEHEYANTSFLAKGQSGSVWKVEKNEKVFAVKVEHEHSTRTRMIEQEAQLLRMANQLNVGPKVADVDIEEGIIVMDFVNGIPLSEWIEKCDSRVQMERGLTRLFSQVRKLDKAGIDHGQLAGKLHNILMGEGDQPTIIDFEKASYVRGVHNVNTLKDMLLGGRTVHSKKILQVWPPAKEELHF